MIFSMSDLGGALSSRSDFFVLNLERKKLFVHNSLFCFLDYTLFFVSRGGGRLIASLLFCVKKNKEICSLLRKFPYLCMSVEPSRVGGQSKNLI